MDAEKDRQLDLTLMRLLADDLSEQEVTDLRIWLKTDTEALDRYLRFMTIHTGLRQTHIETENLPVPDLPAPFAEQPVITFPTAPARLSLRPWIGMAALIAVLMGLTWLLKPPASVVLPEPGVATLLGSQRAIWKTCSFDANDMRSGHWSLTSGWAKIQLHTGPTLLIQGPTDFELSATNRLAVHHGKLVASVPQEGKGFSIVTPQTTLVDYGTRFGFITDPTRSTEAHVFQGRVALRLPTAPNIDAVELSKGEAALLTPLGDLKSNRLANPYLFVHDLLPQGGLAQPGRLFSLADTVGNGNGFGTGRLNWGIDPVTGRFLPHTQTDRLSDENGRYHLMVHNRYVDGVFVPNAGSSENIISSTNLVFEDCPATDSTYYGGIFNGALMTMSSSSEFHPGALNQQIYGTPDHPALNIHSNAGITFNLDTIRDDNPGTRILRFQSECGISSTVPRPRRNLTEFWVLIDGKVAHHFQLASQETGSDVINIKLKKADRFLTLATTTVGDAAFSWSFFAMPVLELEAIY